MGTAESQRCFRPSPDAGLFFAIALRGGGPYSVDRLIGKELWAAGVMSAVGQSPPWRSPPGAAATPPTPDIQIVGKDGCYCANSVFYSTTFRMAYAGCFDARNIIRY